MVISPHSQELIVNATPNYFGQITRNSLLCKSTYLEHTSLVTGTKKNRNLSLFLHSVYKTSLQKHTHTHTHTMQRPVNVNDDQGRSLLLRQNHCFGIVLITIFIVATVLKADNYHYHRSDRISPAWPLRKLWNQQQVVQEGESTAEATTETAHALGMIEPSSIRTQSKPPSLEMARDDEDPFVMVRRLKKGDKKDGASGKGGGVKKGSKIRSTKAPTRGRKRPKFDKEPDPKKAPGSRANKKKGKGKGKRM